MQYHDVVIAGAGVVGLSLALELRKRGRNVLVIDRDASGIASRAAAGMLAGHDPHNPPALQTLANLALDLYPSYLEGIRTRSGLPVPIQTEHVLQAESGGQPGYTLIPALSPVAGNFTVRPEQSLDPRDLHTALCAAVESSGARITIIPGSRGDTEYLAHTQVFVDCKGSWSPAHNRPAKGQMLRIALPPGTLALASGGSAVIRNEDIYIVPRLDGSALIGATVEDAGFDLTLRQSDLDGLRQKAATLLPAAASAPEVESWAGLRPRTLDDLPILGEVPFAQTATPGNANNNTTRHYVANGLFRNGILLAPAVAHVMAQVVSDQEPAIPLHAFAPERFAPRQP